MEIISYVGFEPSRKSFKYFFNKFVTQKKYNSSYSFNLYSTNNAFSVNNYVPRIRITPKLVFVSLGRCVSFVQRNVKSILKFASILMVILIAVFSTCAVISYSQNHTGPLTLSIASNSEFETLDKIMASFALEGTSEFLEDGTLVSSQDDYQTDISNLFCQPVTYQTYKVLKGDTISGITKKFGLKNISTLIAVNDIDNVRQLCAGQKLKIPSIDGLIYTVKAGNSLAGISAKYNVTMEDLLDANELESEQLHVGQQLFIPGAKLDTNSLRNALGDLFKCPITAKYKISSYFGRRADPFSGAPSNHTGVDFACPTGTPIIASMGGKVAFVGYSNIFGNYIIINHSNGYQTLYAHLSKTISKKGTYVNQGTRIGLVGSTGYSTGPHLHFTVYKNGKLMDPLKLIK